MGKQIEIPEVVSFLKEHDHYLLLTHLRPDGDTIGSAVALCKILRAMGKEAWLCENPEMTDTTLCYTEGTIAPDGYIPETILAIDMATTGLFTEVEKKYVDKVDLTLDHHESQQFYAKETCVHPEYAACGELVYFVGKELVPITEEIAIPLYVAISTDTGGFIYANTTPQTHEIIAQLMKSGMNISPINKKHFRTKSLKRMQLESALVAAMESYDDGKTVVMSVPLALMERFHASERDAEDLSALCAMVEGANASVTLRELRPDVWKLSLRTDASIVNASDACGVFGGGGHGAAAGATIEGTYNEVRDKVCEAIRKVRK